MGALRKLLLRDEHVCPWWFAYSFDNPIRRLVHPAGKIVRDYVGTEMTVIDIGCGMGYFALEMARRVGPEGRVIAVDLQEKMLVRVGKRAERAGLADRIILHPCGPDQLGVDQEVDFVLTFWMVHEVPDRDSFLDQVHRILKRGGSWLVVEPKVHTPQARFQALLASAGERGYEVLDRPKIRLSYAGVLGKI
ncbi:MAG: class I SAM-dependent methyltransferase [Fidelibacterota bacterium]|nr:MAG: class I SAM-dependent methyltransferase [Candidatus Neomarinimicrobiota bacterium]